MAIIIGVPRETLPGEKRVAMDPDTGVKLLKSGAQLLLQKHAGESAFFPDTLYKDVQWADTGAEVYAKADIILKVQGPEPSELPHLRSGQILISFLDPHRQLARVKQLQQQNVTALAMELVPRISRAQAIDALSSQANLAGYKCALLAAHLAAGFFPMLTTAAGTVRPAKVVVIGAGVAGLQTIATAKRLGAQVEAYDIRPAAKEQVESLGAKLIDTGVNAEGDGGYARELTAEEKQQQADVLAQHLAKANAVITTAAIPGRPAPKIITRAMVENMLPGSVIIDMAAETGGNCELTQPGESVWHQAVLIHGPLNLASGAPKHASELYARNLLHLLQLLIQDGELKVDWQDEVLAGTCLTRDGKITHPSIQKLVEGGA